jgi:hypothetical protein
MIKKDYNVHPANGHIATSNLYDASDWGNIYSIWPFDDSLHYAWIDTKQRNENKIWEIDWGLPQGNNTNVYTNINNYINTNTNITTKKVREVHSFGKTMT